MEDAAEVGAALVLHHQEGRAVLPRADLEDARHVLAREASDRARLAEEACLVAAARRAQDLDRHAPAEHLVPGQDDDAHPAAPERALHPVFPAEDRSRRERRRLARSRCCGRRGRLLDGGELARHLACVARAARRILAEHRRDQRLERGRDLGPELARRGRLLQQDLAEDRLGVRAREGRLAGEAF